MLLRGLPASARVWQETNGGWSVTDHLLADLIEATDRVRGALIAQMTTAPGKRLNFPEPLRVPRPGPKKPKTSVWRDLARRLKGG